MYEDAREIQALDDLLERSRRGGSPHLRTIIDHEASVGAAELLPLLAGMRVLALSTVARSGEPRVSAVDGHFLHGAWTFGTDGASVKARHLAARPAVSAAHIDGERLGVFVHGRVEPLERGSDSAAPVIAHWSDHYGSDPFTWGDDIRMFRIVPHWMVAYRNAQAA